MLGNRVAVLSEGKIKQVGVPEKVFMAPSDPEIAALVGVETVIPGRVICAIDGLLMVDANGVQIEAVGELSPGRLVYLCLRPEDITLWEDGISISSSARNRFIGRITRLIPQGAQIHVEVDCGVTLVALVTRASVNQMNMHTGKEILVSFKASAIHLIAR
jgi:molybdopterin-binding protein